MFVAFGLVSGQSGTGVGSLLTFVYCMNYKKCSSSLQLHPPQCPFLALPTITRNMNQNTLGSRANRNTSKHFKVSIKTGVILAVSTASTTFVMLGAVWSVGGDVGRSRAVPTRALVRCLCGEGSFWTFGQKNREFQHSLKLGTGLDGFAFRSSVTLRVTFLCA